MRLAESRSRARLDVSLVGVFFGPSWQGGALGGKSCNFGVAFFGAFSSRCAMQICGIENAGEERLVGVSSKAVQWFLFSFVRAALQLELMLECFLPSSSLSEDAGSPC